ncbi:hypothetical protein Q31b_42810 [Novipirellula aureliae]|uniref:Uncharacterized protein n=1 Tax=Novipirellula aureliae TaxID=2527966 RepID=A0A5C6DJD5_9BACT|nr:hypothetical protein Q31b_42810 [Novipirellula aureliae]
MAVIETGNVSAASGKFNLWTSGVDKVAVSKIASEPLNHLKK